MPLSRGLDPSFVVGPKVGLANQSGVMLREGRLGHDPTWVMPFNELCPNDEALPFLEGPNS